MHQRRFNEPRSNDYYGYTASFTFWDIIAEEVINPRIRVKNAEALARRSKVTTLVPHHHFSIYDDLKVNIKDLKSEEFKKISSRYPN